MTSKLLIFSFSFHSYSKPGCVNTTEVDIKKSSRMKNPHKTRKVHYILLLIHLSFKVRVDSTVTQTWTVHCSLLCLSSTARLLLFYPVFLLSQSVYGLQNDIRTHSPTHTPAPEAKQPTEEELQEQVRPTDGALPLKMGSLTIWSQY